MFSTELKQATKLIQLPKWEARDVAPETLAGIFQAYNETGKVIVWAGASDKTVWGAPSDNHLFRAWHDWCHILGASTFDAQGEAAVCRMQQQQVESSHLQAVLQIEIMGQLEHMLKSGAFPVDQIEFFKNMIKQGATK